MFGDKGNRIYTGAAGKVSDQCRFNGFLKIDTDSDKTSISVFHNTIAVICRCALSPARGGRRKKSDRLRSTSPVKILKARMKSARRRLRSSEKRLS